MTKGVAPCAHNGVEPRVTGLEFYGHLRHLAFFAVPAYEAALWEAEVGAGNLRG